jgi:ketosteroid isomerase-like protein
VPGIGQVRDGQIVQLTEYWNLASFLEQVGAFRRKA